MAKFIEIEFGRFEPMQAKWHRDKQIINIRRIISVYDYSYDCCHVSLAGHDKYLTVYHPTYDEFKQILIKEDA